MHIFKNHRGISLIITFFILTIILSVVLSVSVLFYNQIKIIRNIGNSVAAFYVADSGVEKTLYYDRKQIPDGGKKGLCNICNACPTNCTPGLDGDPGDCIESKCQGCTLTPLSVNGCDLSTCGDCEVSFNSFFGRKNYGIKASVIPSGMLFTTSIDSKGNYESVSRKIKLIIGDAATTPSDPLLSVFATASPNPANVGQTVTFFATPSGGTGSYSYAWTGDCTGTSQNCATPFATSGDKVATVTVTSGAQIASASAIVTVVVAPSTVTAVSGAAGNWTLGSAWVGGVAPTSSDNCLITSATTSITIDSGAVCRSVDFTGFTGAVTHNAAATLTIGDATAGLGNIALKLVSGMTYTLGSATTSAISFVSTSTTVQTVDFAGKTSGNVTYDGVAGSWQMTGNHNTGTTATVNLTRGTLNTNGQTMSTGLFNSSNSNTRVLTLGASAITITGIGNSWALATTTGLTFTANTASITLSGAGNTFAGGGLTYGGTVSFTGSGTQIITNGNSFANLTRTGTATKTNILQLNANQRVTGTLALNGNSAINRLLIRSNVIGVARTINNTGATMTWSNVDFKDIRLSVAFNASAIVGGSGNAGGNTNITFTTAANQYMKTAVSVNWSASNWYTTSGGSILGRVPLPQDTAIFDALSITAGSVIITQDMPRIGGVNFTGVTNTPTWTTSTAASVFGSLTLVSGMTLTASAQAYTFEGRGAFTLTNAGKTWAKSISLTAPGGTLTLQDALITRATRSLIINNGTFNANNFNVTTGLFSSSNLNTRTITMGSGTWTLAGTGTVWTTIISTNLTLNSNTSTIKIKNTSNIANTFSGGGKTFNNIWWSRGASTASNTISGSNTFKDFRDNGSAAHSILFTAGTTQTVTTFTVSGTAGNLITINSNTTGTHALVKAGGGTICRNYLNIQHSVATPASTWFAGINSINNQGVATAGSGWTFTTCP